MSAAGTTARAPKRPMSPLKKWALIGITLLLVGSVAARMAFANKSADSAGGKASVAPSSLGGQSLLPGDPQAGGEPVPAEPQTGVAKALPYVTEGSFFALLGFALGYASRKFVKVGLIFLAIFFVGVQVLVYLNVVDVDWSRGVELVNKFVLNIQEGESIQKVLTDKLPTAGGLAAGYFLGFRKG